MRSSARARSVTRRRPSPGRPWPCCGRWRSSESPLRRGIASRAAAALAAAGVADPPWAATIGRVRVAACWRLADVFGDQASLLSVFGYGRREHGLVALVDFNHLGGWVKDLFVTLSRLSAP